MQHADDGVAPVNEPVMEINHAMRSVMGIPENSSLDHWVQIWHKPQPVSVQTRQKLEKSLYRKVVTDKPRMSRAGRKPSHRPTVNDTWSRYVRPRLADDAELCPQCKTARAFVSDGRRGDVVCTSCGFVNNDLAHGVVDPDAVSYEDTLRAAPAPPTRRRGDGGEGAGGTGRSRRAASGAANGQTYDHVANFNTMLMQLQGLQHVPGSPAELVKVLRTHFLSHNVDLSTVTPLTVFQFLKAHKSSSVKCSAEELAAAGSACRLGICVHKYTTFYDHIVYLAHCVSGRPLPVLTPEDVEFLNETFRKVLTVWRNITSRQKRSLHDEKRHFNVQVTRKNMLSYKFIIFKSCEIRGLRQICEVCYLPRIPSKMDMLNQYWKLICASADIPYIDTPTIHSHHK